VNRGNLANSMEGHVFTSFLLQAWGTKYVDVTPRISSQQGRGRVGIHAVACLQTRPVVLTNFLLSMGESNDVKRAVFFAVALVVGIGGVLILYFPFRQPPPSPLPIVIARFKTPHSGLVHIAEAKGYFAEVGLTATIRTVLTGHEAIAQVLRGEVDVGSTAETPIARALAEGKQPKIIATIFSSRWSSGIVGRKDHGILKPADLKGKRIGFVSGTNTHYDLETLLAFHNIPLDSITMVPGMPDQLVTALVSGEVDAASIWIPFMTQMQQKLGNNAETFYPKEGYAQTVNLVVRSDYVMRNREATDRVLRALLKAEFFAETHPKEATDIIASASGLDASALYGHGDPLTYELTLKQSLLKATENQVRWYFRRGLVPSGPFPDVLNAVETEPLRAIKPTGVTISK
jgi:ABC-type nitrate/sulfonate/bicarbonate transport system substrate-binding protein